jgi:hypothetical protein
MNYFRQAKVANFYKPVPAAATTPGLPRWGARFAAGPPQPLRDEDICGLEIAVQYALVMRRFNAGDHLTQYCHRALNIQGALPSQKLIEAFAVNVFHHQKKYALRTLAEIRDINNVGMSDRSGRASFAFEARNRFTLLQHLVTENVGPNGLDGYATSYEILIARQIDLAHRTPAQTFLEQVTRREQSRPRQRVFCVCLVLRTGDYVVVITTFAAWALAHGKGFRGWRKSISKQYVASRE